MRQNILENITFYNNMSLEQQQKYIHKIHIFYKKNIPLIKYSERNIKYALKHDFDNVHVFYTNHITVEEYYTYYMKNYKKLLKEFIEKSTENPLYIDHILSHDSFEINPMRYQQLFVKKLKHTSTSMQTIINTLEINDVCMIDINPIKGINLLAIKQIINYKK